RSAYSKTFRVFASIAPTRVLIWASPIFTSTPWQLVGHGLAEIRERADGAHACFLEGRKLLRRRTLAARDDRAGMPHTLAGRRRDAGDVADDRLLDVLREVFGRGFLVGAADLDDHDDALRRGVFLEQRDAVDEVHAAHGVAADADASALPQAAQRRLIDGLVRQRSRTRHDADRARLVDRARHDADLGAARRDDAGAVRADEPRPRALHD